MTKKVNQKRAAQILNVAPHTIGRWVKIGKLRCTRIGQRKLQFDIPDLEQMRQVVNPTSPKGGGNGNG